MDDSVGGTGWYLAQVRPNSFEIAERNLVRQGFRVFCPKQEVTRRRAGRFVRVMQPLFPGYLFVPFDPTAAAWRVINSTYGVSRLVHFGDHVPARVPQDLIIALMARCDANGCFLPPEVLKAGDRVRVLSGPFAQFVATVESLTPQRRVWVLLDLMGNQTRASIDVAELQHA
jgi:transcriptional antiterminator RfaH